MKAIALLLCVLHAGGLLAVEPLLAKAIQWDGDRGTKNGDGDTVYCLQGRGYGTQSSYFEMRNIISEWLNEHPKAVIVPVATVPRFEGELSKLKMTYVWIVDGEENFNIELVRRGKFYRGNQTVIEDLNTKLLVPRPDYQAFRSRLKIAGDEAERKKIGLWSKEK